MKKALFLIALGISIFAISTALSATTSNRSSCGRSLCHAVRDAHAAGEQIVFISGVESGRCFVPAVHLWNKPGGMSTGARVTSTVSGCKGLPVKVIETRQVGPRTWYYIKTFGVSAGKSGWVSETLVRF